MTDATILIAAWNAADSLPRTIESALRQEGASCDTIVVDDLSNDGTADVARAAGARVISLSSNGGPGAARNAGLEAAQGNWIAVLDSDDTMAPRRIRRMINLAEEHRADLVLGNFLRLSPLGAPLESSGYLSDPAFDAPTLLDLEGYLRADAFLRSGKSIGYLKPVIRRDFLLRSGLRYNPSLRNGEDFHLVISSLAAGARVIFDPVPDYHYTVRPGSISHRVNLAHLDALIAADRDFISRHATRMSRQGRDLFSARLKRLIRLRTSEKVLRALKAGRISTALSSFYNDPAAGRMIFGKLLEAGRNRVPNRRDRAP